jgi:D-aminopeptidase
MSKPRARDIGIPFDGVPGKYNAITDVPGVEVGATTLLEDDAPLVVGQGPVRTGVTAILPRGKGKEPSPVWAGQFSLNGNGEMTGSHWINDAGYFLGPICLTNTHSVGMAHHATVGWMAENYASHFQDDHGWAMPVVAETYDGCTNDIVGRHVTEDHVLAAINGAETGPVSEGNSGGGTGMLTYEFKGGTGTASRKIELGGQNFVMGALVQSNFGSRADFTVRGVPVGKEWPEDAPLTALALQEQGSIIVILGTDLPLLPNQLQRLAKRASIGISRTGTPGGHYSGDIFLAFSTANDIGMPPMSEANQPMFNAMQSLSDHYLEEAYSAAVDSIEEAILNAVIAAETMTFVKPSGYQAKAIDHDRLQTILKKYNRLA